MTQFEIYAGIDWSTQTHQIVAVDADGELLGERTFAHSGDGLAGMADWILGHCPEGEAAAAIEKPHGPEVDALPERGVAVFALNPKQLDRFRDRFSPAGAKDDRRDALVLAGSLATDRKAFREAEAPPPEIVRLRELSRTDGDLVEERTRLTDKLKVQIRRYYPAFLEAAPDLGRTWALDLRTSAEDVPTAPGTAEAVAESAGRIVRRLKALNAEIKEIRSEIDQAVDRVGTMEGGQAAGILRSVPGIGPAVLAVILSEAFDSIRKAELQALKCCSGLAPVTKRSGRTVLIQRRLAANGRLRNAAHHWAMAAIQRDKAGRAKYHALRSRGHKHARAPGSVADRLLGVVCRMIETGQTFDPERRSKNAL